MFLAHNEENLQLPEMVLTKERSKDYMNFMNFLMAAICNGIFQERFPRVLPKMRASLQPSIENSMGDWFLFENGMVIRFYGFNQPPYLLHAFLTPRVFSMDLIR